MPGRLNNLSKFWQELKRRRVIRVIIVYAATGFAIIEFIDIITEPLKLPEWALIFSIVMVAVGFPIVVILAWVSNNSRKEMEQTETFDHGVEPGETIRKSDADLITENSIVILPFQDMSPNKDNEYFCDGITEEIINDLTQIKVLHVVSRTSSFSFKGKNIDVREIGGKLGVATLLEGSVRKSGNRLRITAQLIDIKNGYHLWSERFDRELEDIFEIQDEISMQIVDKLKISLKPEEEKVLVKRYTNDLEAHNLYLKGRYYWNKITEKGLTVGMDFFKQAIQKDPEYALAYSGMADCYCRLGWYSYLSPEEAFPNARDAANKALKIADHLAEAYASMAFVSMCYDRDYTKAEKEIKQAIRLNPGYAEAHFNYSVNLSINGRHKESIAEAIKALEIDPLTLMMYLNLGMRHYYAREFDQSLEYMNKSLEMDPGFEIAHYYRGFAYLQKKMYQEALTEIRRVISILGRNNPGFLGLLGIIHAFNSNRAAAEKVIDELLEQSKQKYISPFWIAVLYFVLDEKEPLFEWLEKGYKEHDVLMIFLKVDPIFDPIQSDPRFQGMLKKMNLIK
ncbi:MAG: hypothetical protein AMS26_07945 [Bacteroides sp. SM23_62]|nr:MAG: hypothetical protein AMS26_07945 [Bacteroides sp. SM23_62]